MRPWIRFILEYVSIDERGVVGGAGALTQAIRLWPKRPVVDDFVRVMRMSALKKSVSL